MRDDQRKDRPDNSRRRFLRDAGSAAVAFAASGCSRLAHPIQHWFAAEDGSDCVGGFVGQNFERGHRLRGGALPTPDTYARTDVVIVGSGISGLAAARGLRQRGVEDFQIFELEDEAGGNSRGGNVAGFDCPWGAHYLPLPGPDAVEVATLLDEFGLRKTGANGPEYDETQLCHSPQERLYIAGGWQDGLLPVRGQDEAAFAAYRRFAELIRAARQPRAYTIPTAASAWTAEHAALDAVTFSAWLDQHDLTHPALRWYLDYCCRDDYGAGSQQVSAWAGIHYFASRHGFSAPGDANEPDPDFEHDGLLTWPEGNARLARQLAMPVRDRLRTGALVLRVETLRDGVAVDVLDVASQRVTRWQARRAIIAVPLFIAARLVMPAPDALRAAAARLPHAPWLVANLYVDQPLVEHRHDAPLSWDNVLYGAKGLGYVNAANQLTRPYFVPTVLTYYRALGDDPIAGRELLLDRGWDQWRQRILADLEPAHPNLRRKLRRLELMRYGHAMAIPAPGVRGDAALAALRATTGSVLYAHSDLSGYSIFEEALHWGLRAGRLPL